MPAMRALEQGGSEGGQKEEKGSRGWGQGKTQLLGSVLVASCLQLALPPSPLMYLSIMSTSDFVRQPVPQLGQTPVDVIASPNPISWQTSPHSRGLWGTFHIPNKYHVATDEAKKAVLERC